ncbi:MAG TPA: hypothetical protein VM050_06140 [Patescibacteria group bacterium]|nr:hypothetical protein [Patescibacteria group bacterium]
MVIALLVYGLATRPLLVYSLSTPLDYNATVNLESGGLELDLNVENVGASPSRVTLRVRLYNASLAEPVEAEIAHKPYYDEFYIHIDDAVRRYENGVETLYIEPEGEDGYLAVTFIAQPRLGTNPARGFYDSLAVFRSQRPTALLLKNMGDGVYKRVQSK